MGEYDILGVRHWGKNKEPRRFNIIVNDMKDVLRHQSVELYSNRDRDISIASALDGGAISGGLRRKNGKRKG